MNRDEIMNNKREEIFKNYLTHAGAYVNWEKLDNGDDPDEHFMRSIEENAGISVNAKKAFREEMMIRAASHKRKGLVFKWHSHQSMKYALLSLIQEDTP